VTAPAVSIILPTFNRLKYLRLAIDRKLLSKVRSRVIDLYRRGRHRQAASR
jgi:hypothetical protein